MGLGHPAVYLTGDSFGPVNRTNLALSAMGVVGGIIAPIDSDTAWDIRLSMLVCAAWTVLFTLPTFLNLHDDPNATSGPRVGIVECYAQLFRTVRRLWRTSPQTVYFLVASALFRDGLADVFAYGAVSPPARLDSPAPRC